LPVYAHARAAEASWMRLLGRLSGVGQRYFSERLPHLRIATDDGRPAAHPRQLSGIVLLGRWFAERLLEVIRMDEKRLWETRWNCSRGHRRGHWVYPLAAGAD